MMDDRKTHVVYHEDYVLMVGGLMRGFEIYGPFDAPHKAYDWAKENLVPGVHCQVIPLNRVDMVKD